MSKFKLYEINEALLNTLDQAYHEAELSEGEVPDDISLLLDQLQIEKEEKVLDTAKYYKSLKAESEAIKAEADNLRRRYQSINNYSESLKNYLQKNISPEEKYKDSTTIISFRKSERVSIDKEEEIASIYYSLEKKFSLSSIKRDIKSGINVPGAHIDTIQNIQIK